MMYFIIILDISSHLIPHKIFFQKTNIYSILFIMKFFYAICIALVAVSTQSSLVNGRESKYFVECFCYASNATISLQRMEIASMISDLIDVIIMFHTLLHLNFRTLII